MDDKNPQSERLWVEYSRESKMSAPTLPPQRGLKLVVKHLEGLPDWLKILSVLAVMFGILIAYYYLQHSIDNPADERSAVIALYESISRMERGDKNWTLSNSGLANKPVCSWDYIECENAHIVFIYLGNGLGLGNQESKLPPEIGQLTNLRTLWLDDVSELPPEIGQLTNLQLLLMGNVSELPPEIGQLTSLRELRLGNISELPPEIGQLTNLQVLEIGRISELPPEIGQLTSLLMLNVDHVDSSVLPSEIGQLANLQILCVGGLSKLPLEIDQLPRLRYVSGTCYDTY